MKKRFKMDAEFLDNWIKALRGGGYAEGQYDLCETAYEYEPDDYEVGIKGGYHGYYRYSALGVALAMVDINRRGDELDFYDRWRIRVDYSTHVPKIFYDSLEREFVDKMICLSEAKFSFSFIALFLENEVEPIDEELENYDYCLTAPEIDYWDHN